MSGGPLTMAASAQNPHPAMADDGPFGSAPSAEDASRAWGKRRDMLVHERDPYNAEPPGAALAASHVTPNDAFYSRNHGAIPAIDPATWRLHVGGLVWTPLELGLKHLKHGFEHCTLAVTLQCAGNRRAALTALRDIPGEAPWGPCATATAEWTGVRLADVLRMAGVNDGAGHVEFTAPDIAEGADPPQSYASSIPLRKALSDEVLLAWQMNGQDLSPVHGRPVRVVVPGYIGARSVKWVEQVTVLPDPSNSYFQATAYRLLPADGIPGPDRGLSLGSVALNSAILSPSNRDTVHAGIVEVSGYAYAGDDRGIARVDVSVDQGRTWIQAELDDQSSPWTWRLWRTRLLLDQGQVRITVRAWDTTAATQPESMEQVWNPKGYVNNAWGHVTLTVIR
jgi:sulfite oxidase